MINRLLVLLTISTLVASISDELIIFGDSLTDDGAQAQGLSHGFGRYSNGPVWPEYLNSLMKINGKYSNFAYAGAKSSLDNYYFLGWSGVLWQVATYLNSTKTVPPNALIILNCGGNDIFDGDNKTIEVIQNTITAIRNLAQKGARKVLLLNLIDLSIAPGIANGPTAQYISTLVAEINMRYQSTVTDANFASFPSLDLKLFDLKTAASKAIATFSNTKEPFTHHRNNTLPNEIQNYAFFDEYHPSTFVHLKLAQAIFEFVQNWDENGANGSVMYNTSSSTVLFCLISMYFFVFSAR